MRIFVTGASGFVGSAVVDDLVAAGHEVVGLARSDASATSVEKAGAQVRRGSLDDLDGLRAAAADSEGVVHTAFNNDFTKYQQTAEHDRRVIETMGQALAGSGRPLVVTSVTALLAPGELATERDAPAEGTPSEVRIASENTAIALADQDVRSAAVRLAASVHDGAQRGFASILADIARQSKVSAYVGDTEVRWPAVHRRDAARLFRLAVESATPGSRLHGVDEQGIPVRDLAELIGERLHLPVRAISADEAGDHFGPIAEFLTYDNPVSSALTREWLHWEPRSPGLLDEMRRGDDLTPVA